MCFWVTLSFIIIHGPGMAVEPSGIFFIESVGAYLLGRCYIRNSDDFFSAVRMMFLLILIILPFAVIEAYTNRNVLLELFGFFGQTFPDAIKEPRWGLRRVQGPFEHPILFGVFCGSMLALVHYVLGFGKSFIERWFRTMLTAVTAFFALSSGPLSAMTAQILLISWDTTLATVKARWKILTAGLGSLVILIESVASRSSPEILMAYFAFNHATAYNRVLIWEFGTRSVANHPFLGIGLNDWERPYWMTGSMDMFWLVPAVRHGIPAGLFLLLIFFSIFFGLARKKGLEKKTADYRTGILICLTGFFIAGWMVHYWNATYALFMFILGSAMWILDANPEPAPAPETGRTARPRCRPARRDRRSQRDPAGKVVGGRRRRPRGAAPGS